MALRGASSTTVDSDWVDFKELAKENTAVLFTVQAIEPSKDFGNGPVEPVIADVIILTGVHAGERHTGERILAAGIRNRLTTVGDSIVGRVRPYGQRNHPGLEAEEDGDIELAEKALAKFESGVPAQRKATKATKPAADESDEPPF